LLVLLALAACKSDPPAPSPAEEARTNLLKELRGAAAGAEFRKILAEEPGATDLAKQDLKDATARLGTIERRAIQNGLISEQIDPEVAAGQKLGAENARQTLDDRAARKAAESKP
ncbi:MAG: hypothetical protein JWO82_1011, partial [Akkermansiaceae bacterium]|nr:hypothetical protein [Akkermansiaceae bacterium]